MKLTRKFNIYILVLLFIYFCMPMIYVNAESNTKKNPPNIKIEVFSDEDKLTSYNVETSFQEEYTHISGVLTFRGNNFRTAPSYGYIPHNPYELSVIKSFRTSSLTWGGGAGWTGQPLIVKWPKNTIRNMNLFDKFKTKENFVEAICVSLDGCIYFFDLETGEPSRKKISIDNPIKGTPSIDPRGYPILYVGQGIKEKGSMGYRIFSLIDGSLLYFINGKDPQALRGWDAFDSSPLINIVNDRLILCGENGLLYNIKLHTKYYEDRGSLSISPEIIKLRYKGKNIPRQGIESSPVIYKNYVYFADNSGTILCIDLNTMSLVWSASNMDDTDATLTLDLEGDKPFLYCANEVDHQGKQGNVYIRKYDALSGDIINEKVIEAYSILGEHPVNGGALATNIVGKRSLSNCVIFSIARYKTMNGGLLICLDKKSFQEKWRIESPHYCWSSPVDVYSGDGSSYIINCDSSGRMSLIDALNGEIITSINLHGNIESSPAIYNDTIVVPSRNGKIYFIKIHGRSNSPYRITNLD